MRPCEDGYDDWGEEKKGKEKGQVAKRNMG
jgi:hypothetical protein